MIFTKAYKMIGNKSIAVIGGGISSLTLLLNISKQIKTETKTDKFKVKVFERNLTLGGRINAQQSPQEEEELQATCADMGANFIDYENQNEKKLVEAHLPQNLLTNFKEFQGKFMIWENSNLTQPEKQKIRYYYKNGFKNMAEDWKKQIQSLKTMDLSVIKDKQVQKVELQNNKWRIKFTGQKEQTDTELFDILIFGTPAPVTKKILQASQIQNSNQLLSELNKINYTQQISAIFELEPSQLKSTETPYSILLKNYELTFICFHQQKYPKNSKNIAVIQTNEQLTEKYAKKLQSKAKDLQPSHNQIYNQISQEIWKLIPLEIKQKFKFTQNCLGVHYWPQSLVKPTNNIQQAGQMLNRFNHELNQNFKNEKSQTNLYFTGDYLNNKSRVTGAMAVGIKVSQEILKDHFNIQEEKVL